MTDLFNSIININNSDDRVPLWRRDLEKINCGRDMIHESKKISPERKNWIISEGMNRTLLNGEFNFNNIDQMHLFVNSLMEYQLESQHRAVVTIDPGLMNESKDIFSVSIDVFTRDVNSITDIDKEFARDVLRIYKDVMRW